MIKRSAPSIVLGIAILLMLNGCSGQAGSSADYLRMYDIPIPRPDSLMHCHSYGCQTKVFLSLPTKTQTKLKKLFHPPTKTEEDERRKIAKAIGILERDMGALAGTDHDKRGTFRLYQDKDNPIGLQQDCIDESTNTTIYLTLLEGMGFLAHHMTSFPANRQPFLGGAPWWHQTAVIRARQTGALYAVDSWFRDNGADAFIVPLDEWKDGWMAPRLKH